MISLIILTVTAVTAEVREVITPLPVLYYRAEPLFAFMEFLRYNYASSTKILHIVLLETRETNRLLCCCLLLLSLLSPLVSSLSAPLCLGGEKKEQNEKNEVV